MKKENIYSITKLRVCLNYENCQKTVNVKICKLITVIFKNEIETNIKNIKLFYLLLKLTKPTSKLCTPVTIHMPI